MLLQDFSTETGLMIEGSAVILNCVNNIIDTLVGTKAFDTMGSSLAYRLQEPISQHEANSMTVKLIENLKNELPGIALNERMTRAEADYNIPGYNFYIVLEVDGQLQEHTLSRAGS